MTLGLKKWKRKKFEIAKGYLAVIGALTADSELDDVRYNT